MHLTNCPMDDKALSSSHLPPASMPHIGHPLHSCRIPAPRAWCPTCTDGSRVQTAEAWLWCRSGLHTAASLLLGWGLSVWGFVQATAAAAAASEATVTLSTAAAQEPCASVTPPPNKAHTTTHEHTSWMDPAPSKHAPPTLTSRSVCAPRVRMDGPSETPLPNTTYLCLSRILQCNTLVNPHTQRLLTHTHTPTHTAALCTLCHTPVRTNRSRMPLSLIHCTALSPPRSDSTSTYISAAFSLQHDTQHDTARHVSNAHSGQLLLPGAACRTSCTQCCCCCC